jgi:hypothetical protein
MRWLRKLNASYLCCNLIKGAVHKVVYKVLSFAAEDLILIEYHVLGADYLGHGGDLYSVDV